MVKKLHVWVGLTAGTVCACLLWLVQEYGQSFLPAIVSILAFILTTYITLRVEKSPWIKAFTWAVVLPVVGAAGYQNVREQSREVIYFDIMSPNITAKSAFLKAKRELPDSAQYRLLDVIGSYYICLKKPKTFFHRFPEWVFVFRGPSPDRLTEVRVTDSRLPDLPFLSPKETKTLHDGDILTYMQFHVPLGFLGVKGVPNKDDDVIVDLDSGSRDLVTIIGSGPSDDFDDVVESINTKVFARVRPIGRSTDHPKSYSVEESLTRLDKFIIAKSEYSETPFYRSLLPLSTWKIDIDQAIQNVRRRGGLAIPPGKFGMDGGPGYFRLYNGKHRNRQGAYWQLPFRIGLRPVIVDANSGNVLAVNNSKEYSQRW